MSRTKPRTAASDRPSAHVPSRVVARRARSSLARERVEEALVRSERRYRELVDHSLGLVCSHDLDGQLLFVNPAAARNLGYEPDDWRGCNLRDFVAAELVPSSRSTFAGSRCSARIRA
ncbi:MAG: PAS domain S-box protein [Acidimicrobiia bacterium]|nr:PAS domain S-box protein [Acidimicrobiia bacterium]